MSLKRNKKQRIAIRNSATSPTKTVTLVKTQQQPGLVATPVLSPQANGHSVLSAVHQDATSTAKLAKKRAPQSGLVTASVRSPKAARRDTHGRFLTKKAK